MEGRQARRRGGGGTLLRDIESYLYLLVGRRKLSNHFEKGGGDNYGRLSPKREEFGTGKN